MICPLCGNRDLFSFFRWDDAVAEQQFVMKSRAEAKGCLKGNIELLFCNSCGLIWNKLFDPKLVEYSKAYVASQIHSKSFLVSVQELVNYLIEKYQLRNKTIVEIGSGDSKFLQLLCTLGNNHGIGYEPNWKPSQEQTLPENIQIIPEAFTEKYAGVQGDFVCCRHVLEHVENPRLFVEGFKRIAPSKKPIFFFEVPNASWTLRNTAFWDIYYEHSFYFSRPSLEELFLSSGFEVTGFLEIFEGQYLCIEVRAVDRVASKRSEESVSQLRSEVEQFANRVTASISSIKSRLAEWSREGPLAIWGAGARAVAFLNFLKIDSSQVELVIDTNPKKWGTFIPGTGQEIVSPEAAATRAPKVILALNSAYKHEIAAKMNELGISAKLVVGGINAEAANELTI